MVKTTLSIVFTCWLFSISAQQTLILRPNAAQGEDAMVHSLNSSVNYGSGNDFAAIAGTNSGVNVTTRSFIKFDLSNIPATAQITSAYLTLFGYPSTGNGTHSTMNGSNSTILQRVTSPWQESTITWNSKPSTTQQNEVIIPATTQDYQNVQVSVKTLIEDIIKSGVNHGLMLKLQTEQKYRKMVFASSDNPDSTLHPMLIITYSDSLNPVVPDSCFTLQPGPAIGKDAYAHSLNASTNIGHHADFAAIAGTNSGVDVTVRSFIDFDLSGIPSGAVINQARLSLYTYNSPANGNHSTLNGSNASVLERITESWDENTLTWNNQPASSSHNSVTLPSSTNSTQHYPDIDITLLVQDMVDSSGYGLMMKLVTESKYRKLLFASSDNADPSIRPKLEVCYSLPKASIEEERMSNVEVYPNPASDKVYLTNYGQLDLKRIKIIDAVGKNRKNISLNPAFTGEIDVNDLNPGYYQLIFISETRTMTSKLIIK